MSRPGCLRRGAPEGAVAHLLRALDEPPSPAQRTGVLLDQGAAESLANSPVAADHLAARAPLREAIELAERCGRGRGRARPGELAGAGGRPRRATVTGVAALTPSERRVADLAAEGLTNLRIALRLGVTTKTVEVHLTNAYRKLAVQSRHELVAALAGPAR